MEKTIYSLLNKGYFRLFVVGLIIAAFSTVFFQLASTEQQEATKNRQDSIMAAKGELMPFKMNMSEDFVVDLGGNIVAHSAQELAQGVDAVRGIGVGFDWPFQIIFSGSKILISANVTNSDNQVVGRITNNTWRSERPDSMAIGDRNYNDYAFEILDINMMPIFNVRVVGSNQIQISGLFHGNNNTALISDNGGGVWANPSQQQINDLLTPMFKYPSSEYAGKLINPTYLTSLPDTSDKMFFEASVLTVVGYVFIGLGVLLAFISEVVREKENERIKAALERHVRNLKNKSKRRTKRQTKNRQS